MTASGAQDVRHGTSRSRGGAGTGAGTADNKGQHTINLAALARVAAARGRLGFNAKLLVEMGEEVGSPGCVPPAKRMRRRSRPTC